MEGHRATALEKEQVFREDAGIMTVVQERQIMVRYQVIESFTCVPKIDS